MRHGLRTLVLLVFVGYAAWGEDPPIPEVRFDHPEKIRDYLSAYLEAPGGPPSISLAVAVDGEMVIAEAVGFADLEAERAATPETPYRTYSISKAITAVGVLQAVEAGNLDLEDNIRKYVPAFPEKRWPVRLVHLLTHTSGIRHYKPNAGEISSTTEYANLADSLVVFANDPLVHEPGTRHLYTSFGFNLLTGALESSSGLPFSEVLQKGVFDPADMTNTALAVAKVDNPDLAKAYWPPRSGRHWEIRELPNVSGKYGSGGITSTPTDLVKMILALERGDLMKPETLELMFRVADPEVAETQTLGWNRVVENDRQVIYRTGASTGYTGIVEYLPEQRVIGAVLINQNQYRGRVPILERVLEYYLD